MSSRPKESLKKTAEEYAYLIDLGETNSEKVKKIRKELGFDNKPLSNNNSSKIEVEDMEHIGIWKPKIIDGKKQFVRDKKYASKFWFYSDIPVISPKSNKKRVLFIGESVARGYLFSPYFTPAKYLQTFMDENTNDEGYEIVDLSCISINMEDITRLCRQSSLLEPDMLVIFAGNNWKNALYPLTDQEASKIIDASVSENRFQIIKKILQDKYKIMINNLMRTIGMTAMKHQIPAVFVIPEFNLKDWNIIDNDMILQWPGGKTKKWLVLKDQLNSYLQYNDYENAERICKALIGINPANPFVYKVLAEIRLKQGNTKEARKYYQESLDTSIYRRIFPPACISFIEETVIKIASEYNIKIVNLKEVFQEYFGGAVVGNDLFIDYCHMNEKGIQIAMNSLGKCILSLDKNRISSLEKIKEPDYKVDKKVIADAHFLAAIHCAHNGEQPYDILYYHCVQAIKASKHVIDHMVNYINMICSKVPFTYNKSCLYFSKFGLIAQYPMLFQPKDCRLMDITLTDAMVDALKTVGYDIKEQVDTLRIKYFKPYEKKIDLLESYYREKSYIYSLTDVEYFSYGEKAYYSFISNRTSFYLIADNKKDVEVEFTYRSPLPESKKDNVKLKVNGITVGSKPAYNKWQDLIVLIPKQLLKKGVNVIDVDWPLIDCIEKDLYKKNAEKYRGDELVTRNSRLIYGDIFRFNAQLC